MRGLYGETDFPGRVPFFPCWSGRPVVHGIAWIALPAPGPVAYPAPHATENQTRDSVYFPARHLLARPVRQLGKSAGTTEEQLNNYNHGITLLCPIEGIADPAAMIGYRDTTGN